ncbi:thioesterase II family protein [Haloechinothrix halophila]|uniref:thioesterase II family protein n=1 Tax=Haloechinothrix halophila TaxID=1069073 RepID=UPI00146F965E|nr:alpha/beta fold hydrolase [Haloechinothrix halophila]
MRPETGGPRVVAVPHAGAGPHALMPLLSHLPEDLDVLGVTLPGREHRFGEPWADPDPGGVVTEIASELALLPRRPTVLFGHSLGAAVAAATALRKPEVCDAVVLSSYPSGGTEAQRAGRWEDAELLDIVARSGGTPEEVLTSDFWRTHLLRLLRGDLTLGSRLSTSTVDHTLPMPVTLLTSDDDELAIGTSLAPGGSRTRRRRFPGGHFYLLDDRNQRGVASEIAAAIQQAAR